MNAGAHSDAGGTPARDPRLRIAKIDLDQRIRTRNPDVEQERRVAIFDLEENNYFAPQDLPPDAGPEPGPFHVLLGVEENRLVIDIRDTNDVSLDRVLLALTPLRRVIRDYFTVCESYFQAIRTASPSQIEAIDMGRRGLHNEGSEILRDRLSGKIDIDFDTARRLFTLVCVLHFKG